MARRRELARADRVLPGLWRLRLPLPWPGVPHGNAYAIAAGDGVVLVDTGLHEPGSMRQLELALDQAGLRVEHVRLVVCTHAHSDHYGQAAPIMERTGAELWMHPNHEHMTKAAEDPERAFERRFEIARQSGVPADALERLQGGARRPEVRHRRDRDAGSRAASRAWRSRPTSATGRCTRRPATRPRTWCSTSPSAGCCSRATTCSAASRSTTTSATRPTRRASSCRASTWSTGSTSSSCSPATAARCATRAPSPRRTGARSPSASSASARSLADGPRTAFDIVPEMLDVELPGPMMIGWGLSEALCYLSHMELGGEVERVDGEDPERWRAGGARPRPSRASRGAPRAARPGSPALPASGSGCRSGLRARLAPGDRSTGGSRKRPRALQPLPGRRRAR